MATIVEVKLGDATTLKLKNGTVVAIDGAGNITAGGTNVAGGGGSAAVGVNVVPDNVVWGLDGSVPSSGWYTDAGPFTNPNAWTPVATPTIQSGGPPPVDTVTLAAIPSQGPGAIAFSGTWNVGITGTRRLTVTDDTGATASRSVVITGSPPPPPPPPPGGVFTVTAGGGFVDPLGKSFAARGYNISPGEFLNALPTLLRQLPGTTFIRLNCGSDGLGAFPGDTRFTQANTDAAIAACIAHGIVVEFEDHSDAFSSGNKRPNTAWYQMMCNKYKGNPTVFCETPNEPTGNNTDAGQGTDAQVVADQVGLIQAIRATGWKNPIGLMSWAGFDPASNIAGVMAQVAQGNQIYATWHNYNFGTAGVDSGISDFHNLYNLWPVVDEFGGDTSGGGSEDAQGPQTVMEDIAQQVSGMCGAAFFTAISGSTFDSIFTDATCTAFTDYGNRFVHGWLS